MISCLRCHAYQSGFVCLVVYCTIIDDHVADSMGHCVHHTGHIFNAHAQSVMFVMMMQCDIHDAVM